MKLLPCFAFSSNPSRSYRLFRFVSCLLLAYLVSSSFLPAHGQKRDAATMELKRGHLLYAKHDLAGAIASYSKAIELRPDWAAAYVHRGYVRRMQGDLDRAIKDYDRAMELDPASTRNDRSVAEAYVNHGFIRKNNLQIGEALVAYDKAIRLYPGLTRTYLQRGQARLLDEDFAGAIADFEYLITNEKRDTFSIAFAYADRSMAKRLLGKSKDSANDMFESLKLMKGREDIIEHHLEELRDQLLILRQIRKQTQRMIS